MKCSRARKQITDGGDRSMSDDLRGHLDSCPHCRAFREKDQAVRQLLALKNYEGPDKDFAARNMYAIRQAIAKASQKEAEATGIWGTLIGFSVPTTRYALASVLMVFLAIHTFLAPTMPVMQTQLPKASMPRMVANQPTIAFPHLNTSVALPPSVVRMASSNLSPRNIQYGTIPSHVVGFEY